MEAWGVVPVGSHTQVLGGVAVQPMQGPSPLKEAGMLSESVGGLVGRRTGARVTG